MSLATHQIKFSLLNVGGGLLTKLAAIRAAADTAPDVLIIVDAQLDASGQDQLASRCGPYLRACIAAKPATSKVGGFVIITKATVTTELLEIRANGRIALFKITSEGVAIKVAVVYAPANNSSKQRAQWFEQHLPSCDEADVITGDFNATLHAEDRGGTRRNQSLRDMWGLPAQEPTADKRRIERADTRALCAWARSNGLKAVHAHHNNNQFTWKARTQGTVAQSLIDMAFARKERWGDQYSVVPTSQSDHCCINFDTISENPQVERPWILNSTILEDENFVETLRAAAQKAGKETQRAEYPEEHWTQLKRLMRVHCQARARQLQSERKLRLKNAQKVVSQLRKSKQLSNEQAAQLRTAEAELAAAEEHAVQGRQLRARLNWTLEGERCSAAFFGLEKAARSKSSIQRLKRPDGSMADSPEGVGEVLANFYGQLYTANPPRPDFEEKLRQLAESRQIPEEVAAELEAPISLEEVVSAAKLMSSKKSPGLDGLSPAIFKAVPELCEQLVDVLHNSEHTGIWPTDMKSALIRPLFKKGDRDDIGNYRPISLLNVDHKIASKAMSMRLLKHMDKIVTPHQAGFVPKRSTHQNAIILKALLQKANQENWPGGVVLYDIQKAFDRVLHSTLFTLLHWRGFGPKFNARIERMVSKRWALLYFGTGLSTPFELNRGVPQGDPLSPELFDIAIDLLVDFLETKPELHDIAPKIGNVAVRALLFADDTATFFHDKESAELTNNLVHEYFGLIGTEVNKKKTEIIFWNEQSFEVDWALPKDATTPFTYLGVPMARSIADYKLCAAQIAKRTARLASWKRFRLTLIGRVLTANASADALFWYAAALADIPDEVANELSAERWAFIFPSRSRNRVAYNKVYKAKSMGGLGLKDIVVHIRALHASWLIRAHRQPDALFSKILLTVTGEIASHWGLDISKPAEANKAAVLILSRSQGFFTRVTAAWFDLPWLSNSSLQSADGPMALEDVGVKDLYTQLMTKKYLEGQGKRTFKAAKWDTPEPLPCPGADWKRCRLSFAQPKLNSFRYLVWHKKSAAGAEPWSEQECAFCGRQFEEGHLLKSCETGKLVRRKWSNVFGPTSDDNWKSLGALSDNRAEQLSMLETVYRLWCRYTATRKKLQEDEDLVIDSAAEANQIWREAQKQTQISFQSQALKETLVCKMTSSNSNNWDNQHWLSEISYWRTTCERFL